MKVFRTDEEAVSPVIGGILVVAIVVILAAVIAAFMFGMVGSSATSKSVGLVVTKINKSIASQGGFDILWQGGSDLNNLQSIDWTVDGVSASSKGMYVQTPLGNDYVFPHTPATTPKFKVGDTTRCRGLIKASGKSVVIIGTFSDGTSQVLFDRTF
jgi:archaeal type IV pilus assembly protein PilA